MIHKVWNVIDFILPPSSAAQILRTVSDEEFLTHIKPGRASSSSYLLSYESPAVRAAISASKFEHHDRAARLLGSVLETWLHTTEEQPTLIVPIPLSRARKRTRGHNQVETILRHTTIPAWCRVETGILQRVKNTPPQTSLSRRQRLLNMKQAFRYTGNDKNLADLERIIVIDDVTTTGATLQAARAALAPYTTLPIDCVALAH